ncbi:response regulator transcription factor [Phototrophicus methaneseepsis]|uniref:Response regulator transcription factor n=1 Tax=Phototrophicus methaneseepsis TaxID=2710758 RepID=A0A7S8EAG5_9CHLR|nr:response regulator transcription factor [Phototrophicus methaneseepsis]QPC83373.1 response regulator transcription factor [Phototrophicus methaneseepsis]
MVYEELNQIANATDAYKARALVIDTEQGIRRQLKIVLRSQGFDVVEAQTAQGGLDQIAAARPDVILADLDLPDAGDVHFIHAIHDVAHVPVLILSSEDNAIQKINALDAGAEDYILKPFSTGELLARVRVALRRTRMVNYVDVFRCGELEVDFIHRIVRIQGHIINLTLTEYDLLRYLIANADQPVTHQSLWGEIRGSSEPLDIHTVRVHMSNLRHKLEQGPATTNPIVTEVGIGYRFQTETQQETISSQT